MGKTLVFGLGNNVDYELKWNASVLEGLIRQYMIDAWELNQPVIIDSERNLVISILSYIQSETGGEQFITDPSIIEEFASRFQIQITMGGTPIRAAIAINTLGYEATLHLVTMNDDVRRLMPPNCIYVQSCKEEHSFPHLIIQYPKDAYICARDICLNTRRSNRIIYHHDLDNIVMEINEELSSHCQDAKVFLISGLNAMQDEALLLDRLEVLERIVSSLPEGAIVYYEDGGFYDNRLKLVLNKAFGHAIDIYGMNEDEMMEYLGREVDLLNAKEVARGLAEVSLVIPARTILVHTRHWVLAFGQNATKLGPSIEQGIQLATTRFRWGDGFTLEEYKKTASLPRQLEGERMAGELSSLLGSKVCCIAAYDVSEKGATTVGLGDAFVGGFLSKLSESDIAY